ncbi:hypothetical protein [Poritiphilus flavus]|nr:hypothetical protein [Poritiphilus flavus]
MKKKQYEGSIKRLPANDIYLNVTHLEKGNYKLKIIHNNKIIKCTKFTKR